MKDNLAKHFNEPTEYLPDFYIDNYERILYKPTDNLNKNSNVIKNFNLNIKEFNDFCLQVEKITEKLISNIFSQKEKIAVEAVEKMINFYNQFLENQSRYQDELVSQNQIEKSWIEIQKSELDKINQDISLVLETFN